MNEQQARKSFDQAISNYEQDFGTFFLARLLDLQISYPDDHCVIEFPIHDFMFNPQGSLHGGVTAIVMDISMGHLLRHKTGVGGATLEMKIQYLRPLRAGRASCEARLLQAGRSVAYLESRLYDTDDRLAAMATATWKPGTPAENPPSSIADR